VIKSLRIKILANLQKQSKRKSKIISAVKILAWF